MFCPELAKIRWTWNGLNGKLQAGLYSKCFLNELESINCPNNELHLIISSLDRGNKQFCLVFDLFSNKQICLVLSVASQSVLIEELLRKSQSNTFIVISIITTAIIHLTSSYWREKERERERENERKRERVNNPFPADRATSEGHRNFFDPFTFFFHLSGRRTETFILLREKEFVKF